jgi:hypothetical protein
MNASINLAPQHLILAIACFALATTSVAGKDQLFLGPPESGTWNGSAKWLSGANGAGTTSYDFNDPANGVCAFVVSNTVAGEGNNADWRCLPFPLGPAAGGARPISFSFAYKLSDPVAPGNEIHVQLRFFDKTGTNLVAEHVIPVGARTGDSTMTAYRTRTLKGIFAPPKARTADIWIDANIFEPWVSGTARFDDFSVTTVPGSAMLKWSVGLAVLLGIGALAALLVRRSRRAPGPTYAPARR